MKHNYQAKLQALAAQGWLVGEPGSINELHIKHDGGCPFLDGGTCKCDPDFELVAIDPDGCGCVPTGFEPGESNRPRNKRRHIKKGVFDGAAPNSI